MERIVLPPAVKRLTDGLPFEENSVGKSGDRVLIYPDAVLKIGAGPHKNEATAEMLRWLAGRLPVPQVLSYEQTAENDFLLMRRLPGRMACDQTYLARPDLLLPLLAEAIRMLWRVDVAACPRKRGLDEELREAEARLEAGLVDTQDAEPDTYGPWGFASPEKLLHWLEDNRPPLEPVFSHGDCCLPNIFFDGGRVSGFIDLGDAGVADKWRDLALCHRSLRHNTDGTYGFTAPGLNADRLFGALGIRPEWDKLRYYVLLDEFF